MQRYASVELRQRVDAAVGPHYDSVFLRLELLATSREARCGCADCRAVVAGRRAELLASLPTLA